MRIKSLPVPKMDLYKYNPKNVPAIDQVRNMEDSAFEDFIGEWLYASKQSEYSNIQLVGGAGDKGRDAVATCSNGEVDYYQCKHYNHALTPSEFTAELGKLCYYTWIKDFPIPRTYFIVASNDIGPALKNCLDNPGRLKKEVLNHWGDRCENKISSKTIRLDKALQEYIESFNFSIVKHYPIQRVINEHLPTIYGSLRFGTPYVERPNQIKVPDELEEHEQRYIAALLAIYSHEEQKSICSLEDLSQFKQWCDHLERQRRDYFAAETIRRAVRDIFTDNDEFKVFKDEVYDGIIDVYEDDFDTGLIRLRKVLVHATNVYIQKSLLSKNLIGLVLAKKRVLVICLLMTDCYMGGKMQNNYLFNSPQEISGRIVLLLAVCNKAKLSVDRVVSLDFISVYGADFGISKSNLHGNNQLRFNEYTSRRRLIKEAINKLVVLGWVKFYPQRSGFLYGISTEGEQIATDFNDSYADQYKENVAEAYSFAQKYSDRKLVQLIRAYSARIAKEK